MTNPSPPSILALFASFLPGKRLIDGGDLAALANQEFSFASGITALAGGGQPGATQLTAYLNRVDTVATNSDSVLLPLALPGATCVIKNNTGQTLAIYGNPANPSNITASTGVAIGDTIATSLSNTQQPTATGITLATTKTAIFFCFVLGQWQEFLTA